MSNPSREVERAEIELLKQIRRHVFSLADGIVWEDREIAKLIREHAEAYARAAAPQLDCPQFEVRIQLKKCIDLPQKNDWEFEVYLGAARISRGMTLLAHFGEFLEDFILPRHMREFGLPDPREAKYAHAPAPAVPLPQCEHKNTISWPHWKCTDCQTDLGPVFDNPPLSEAESSDVPK